MSFVFSKRPVHGGGGHDQTGVPPALQQERQSVLVLHTLHLHAALHGVRSVALLEEFLLVGQGWGGGPVGLWFHPIGVEEPAGPGEPDLHQPAEQRVQRLAPVEMWPVL